MQTSSGRGMQTMEQSLADLTIRRVITREVALSRTSHGEQFLGLLERAGFTDFQSPALSSNGLRVAT
jgi:Tfp pilus assembly ATPase PilU